MRENLVTTVWAQMQSLLRQSAQRPYWAHGVFRPRRREFGGAAMLWTLAMPLRHIGNDLIHACDHDNMLWSVAETGNTVARRRQY